MILVWGMLALQLWMEDIFFSCVSCLFSTWVITALQNINSKVGCSLFPATSFTFALLCECQILQVSFPHMSQILRYFFLTFNSIFFLHALLKTVTFLRESVYGIIKKNPSGQPHIFKYLLYKWVGCQIFTVIQEIIYYIFLSNRNFISNQPLSIYLVNFKNVSSLSNPCVKLSVICYFANHIV